MAQGGSIKERIARAEERTQELNRLAQSKGMTVGPRSGYRMADDEFMHHAVALAHEKLLKRLGIDPDEYKLCIIETWNEEWEKLIDVFQKVKSQQLREELTRGIQIRPDIQL